MNYAVVFAFFMLFMAAVCLWPRRVTFLRKIKSRDATFQKLNAEIVFFNRLRLYLPTTRRLPDAYIKWLGRLHTNPTERFKSAAGVSSEDAAVDKLMYIYAAAKLYGIYHDFFRKRQIYKSILYTFCPRKQIKRSISFFLLRSLRLSRRKLFAVRQPFFKYLETKFVPQQDGMRFSHSYTIKNTPTAAVKNYVTYLDEIPIDCYDIAGKYRFVFDTNMDKFKCTFSHTADTFFAVYRGSVIAVLVQGVQRINFETNIASDGETLNVIVNFQKSGQIRIARFDAKSRAAECMSHLRLMPKLNYLLPPEDIAANTEIENTVTRACLSKFAGGEKLKHRMTAALKYVPTLHLPTLVYAVEEASELFAVIDSFPTFERIAAAGVRLNVVVIYSSRNDIVREFISAYTNKHAAAELVKSGVFIFFVDNVKASSDAIYYFSKMADASANNTAYLRKVSNPKDVNSSAFRNISPDTPVAAAIVSRKNVSYSITDPRTGVTKYHRLLPNQAVYDEFGAEIKPGYDAVCRLPAYIEPCQKSTSRKCTAAAMTISMWKRTRKNSASAQENLRAKSPTVTQA